MPRPFKQRDGRDPVQPARAWRIAAAPLLLGVLAMTTPGALGHGVWGGEQVTLTVDENEAVLRLGCAEARIAGPIRLDDKGRFDVDGLYTAFEGGPSTPSERPVKARFEGVVTGDQLSLTIRHGATETYRLTRGLQSKVIRCL